MIAGQVIENITDLAIRNSTIRTLAPINPFMMSGIAAPFRNYTQNN